MGHSGGPLSPGFQTFATATAQTHTAAGSRRRPTVRKPISVFTGWTVSNTSLFKHCTDQTAAAVAYPPLGLMIDALKPLDTVFSAQADG
jgi:hypothetical protein